MKICVLDSEDCKRDQKCTAGKKNSSPLGGPAGVHRMLLGLWGGRRLRSHLTQKGDPPVKTTMKNLLIYYEIIKYRAK